MVKWKQTYLDELSKMTNKELLDEYTYLAGGDGYDGAYSKKGDWKWEQIQVVLKEKLISIGFLAN